MHSVVCAPICPLLADPDYTAPRVDEALCGWPLVLEEATSGWYLAHTHYGYRGYVQSAGLTLGDGAAARWQTRPKLVVIRAIADVLDAPRVQGAVRTTLVRGCLVAPLGAADGGGWVGVALPDGSEGYMRQDFLAPQEIAPCSAEPEALRARIVETALGYLGTQYRWGGKTPMGIDCSGLTFMAYLLCGVTIFRDARLVPGYPVRPIQRDALCPADLIYFPGHIALYLGDDRYLHATARAGDDGVVVSSLNPQDGHFRADLANQITGYGSIFPYSGKND